MGACSRHGSGTQRMLVVSKEWPLLHFPPFFEAAGISYNTSSEKHGARS